MSSLTASQLVNLCCQAAGCPGYTSQAGQLLNTVLDELCQTYDFDVAKGFYQFNFNPSLISAIDPNIVPGGGPYNLPADYLRAKFGDVFYMVLGVPYQMRQIELWEFDQTIQQAGLQNYPYGYATDLSQSPPVMYVYPPPNGSYPVTVRYQRQMPQIALPETSSVIPWFPATQYLRTRLTGELFAITDDDRANMFLGDSPIGAQGILKRILNLANDNENMAMTGKLDPRRFRQGGTRLPNTKLVGF